MQIPVDDDGHALVFVRENSLKSPDAEGQPAAELFPPLPNVPDNNSTDSKLTFVHNHPVPQLAVGVLVA